MLVRHHITDLLPRTLLCALLALVLLGCAIATQPTEQANDTGASPSPATTVQSAQQEPSDAIDRATSKPYTGSLTIFEDPKRDQKLQINRVMDSGIIYAIEINGDYLKYIENRAKREKLANIRTILGKEDNPLLPEKSVDAVLLLKAYHEVAQPIRLLKRTYEAMRPGALLGIIDRNGKGDDHGLDQDVVIKEAERAGFVLVGQYDFVKPDDVDYFLVFQKK